MQKNRFTQFTNYLILSFAIIIIGFLLIQNICTISFVGYILDDDNRKIKTIQYIANNPIYLIQLAVFIIILGTFIYIKSGDRVSAMIKKNHHSIMRILFLTELFICVMWVVTAQVPPDSDPGKVFLDVQKWRNGDFSTFLKHGYVYRYPFQIGMTIYYYLLSFIFGADNYLGMQVTNAILMPFIILALVKTLCRNRENREVLEVFSYASAIAWVPFTLYSTYIYGLIPAMIFCWGAAFCFRLFFEKPYIRWIIAAGLALGAGVFLKGNNKIWLIVFICIMGYDIIRNLLEEKNWRLLILSVVFTLVMTVFACAGDSIQFYIARELSGYDDPPEAPLLPWINMGLSDASDFAPGYFDYYQVNVRMENDYDTEKIMAQSIQDLKYRLSEFREDPVYAANFFARKIASQWNEPTFLSVYKMRVLMDDRVDKPWMKSLFVGRLANLYRTYCNIFQGLLWLGVFCYLILEYVNCHKADRATIVSQMGIILFMGGFLLHLVWEAMGPYALPYVIALIPYAVMGYSGIIITLAKGIQSGCKNLDASLIKKIGILAIAISLALICLAIGGLWNNLFALNSGEEARLHYQQIGETYEGYSSGEAMLARQDKYGWDYEIFDTKEYAALKRYKYVMCLMKGCADGRILTDTEDGGFAMLGADECLTTESGAGGEKTGTPLESGDHRILIEPIYDEAPDKQRIIAVLIRSRNTGRVLASEDGELLSYLDDINNRNYDENPDALCRWDVLWNDEGYVSFVQEDRALTIAEDGTLSLADYQGDIHQLFTFCWE